MNDKRIVITGMAVNTPLGDNLDAFLAGLLAGKSAITRWKLFADEPIYSKIGGDLSDYDTQSKLRSLEGLVDDAIFARLRKLSKRAPWATKLTMLLAVDAYADAKLHASQYNPHEVATIVAGHNINQNYVNINHQNFTKEPDFINLLYALDGPDTSHVAYVSEVLQSRGPAYTVGGACASGNIALSHALDQMRYRNVQATLVVAPVQELSPKDLHGMALMGVISYKSFNDTPALASRPYDTRREGFVPCHGGAVLVLETLEAAESRGARIYAEVLAADANADGTHLPKPSQEGQVYLMNKLLQAANLSPEQVDYVSVHANSTSLGDLTEIRSIKQMFGKHAYQLKINAPKSMLGHTLCSSATVETVAAMLQMNAGKLHPSINIESMDPEVDLNICQEATAYEANIVMKNSFGFGGINSISLLKRYKGT
jgi:3-oxoacyl-(acyl-carrier-protein) synthase